jgi:predicted DNA-binding protein
MPNKIVSHSLKLREEQWETIDKIAGQAGKTRNEIIVVAIEKYLEDCQEQTELELESDKVIESSRSNEAEKAAETDEALKRVIDKSPGQSPNSDGSGGQTSLDADFQLLNTIERDVKI